MNKQEFINKWAKRIYGLALSSDTDYALQNLRDAIEEILYIVEIRTCYVLSDGTAQNLGIGIGLGRPEDKAKSILKGLGL